MKTALVFTAILITFFCCAQQNKNKVQGDIPVFKQVTHPFMPAITSNYFFFSKDGLMWFATARGLSSFDGSDLVYYSDINESVTYGLNSISFIAEDKDQNLYITASRSFIFYNRKNKRFTQLHYNFKDINKLHDVGGITIHIDNAGTVFFGTGLSGLFIYYPAKKSMEHFNLDPAKPDSWKDRWYNTVSSFARHATDPGKIWVGTYHGIFLFDKQTKKFSQDFEIVTPLAHKYVPNATQSKQFVTVEKMDVINDSTIWFNSWAGGFGHYNINSGKVNLFFRDAVFKSKDRYYGYIIPGFARWKDGKYLLGIFDPHPGIYDINTGKLELFELNAGDTTIDEIRFVTNDRQGNIWLLSKGQLYMELPGYSLMGGIAAKGQMHGVFFDKTTRLYYTTPYGVYVYDTNFTEVKQIPVPLFNNYFTANKPTFLRITKDGSGRFWTTGAETYILQPGQDKFDHIWKILPSLAWIKTKGEFNDVITAKNGNILLSNFSGSVYQINYRTLYTDTITTHTISFAGNFIIKTAPLNYDSNRDMLYITNGKNIAQYFLNSKIQRQIPYDVLFGNVKTGAVETDYSLDNKGRLWLWIPGTGIRIIDPDKLTCVDSIAIGTRGLINGDFTRMRYGGRELMFFQGGNGIVIYNYKKEQSVILNSKNGLTSPISRFMGYCNNYLWVSNYYGMQYFDLDNFDKLTFKMIPALNTILADTAVVFIRGSDYIDNTVTLKYYQNNLNFSFSAPEFFFPERIEYAYQLSPGDKGWHYTDNFNRKIIYTKLSPGKYYFRLKAQMQGGNWDLAKPVEYIIVITPAWWQTVWFRLSGIVLITAIAVYLIRLRIQAVRNKEQQKNLHEKALMELEAKALRSQMNPHFIFNCMNSIKSLIQQQEEEKAVNYLTTFSKLIRTLFSNADKKEISLHDEIETCKLYLQLEAMRFDTSFSYTVHADENLDLKSFEVPALIIQPFIENAIWHGIIPKGKAGRIELSVIKKVNSVEIIIDDNGIGREASKQYKSASALMHNSKGVNLTQSRLELDNLLSQRKAQLEIIDKKDEVNLGVGTKVIITINEEAS